MNRADAVRVTPVRAGAVLAAPWRIWAQGDEFYAGSRCTTQQTKISFHARGRWQVRVGNSAHHLDPGRPLYDAWVIAARVIFLVGDDTVPLPAPIDSKVEYIELPAGEKLTLCLVLNENPEPGQLGLYPIENLRVLATHRLRGGRELVVGANVHPMSQDDRAFVASYHDALRVSYRGSLEGVYAETIINASVEGHGNDIAVVPAARRCFVEDGTT